jgi:predicted phage terminase large subunit-like protein
VPDGVVICLGTRWAEGDLYEKLTQKIKDGGRGWKLILRQAMVPDESEQGWHSYWPEHWPDEALEAKLIELGTALFSCAYNNDIRGLLQGNVFRSDDWKGDSFYFEDLPEGHSYTLKMGIDLASSEKQRADFTARVVSARDTCHECTRKGHIYVMHAYRDKRETGHEEFVYDGWQAYPRIGLVRIEKQQFQSTLIQEVMKKHPSIPVEGVQQDVDKVTRARAVAAKYEAHMVHHHVSLMGSDFELELLAFPKGHDDFVDAEGLSFDMGGGGLTFGAARR